MKCDCCGIESPLEKAFRPIVRVFQKPLRYCPACVEQRARRHYRNLLLVEVPLIVFSGVFAFAFVPMQDRGLLLFGPVFLLSYWACVVPHELGHAFVASLLGLRVFSICLGWVGQIVWRWRIFRTDICVTSLPSGGFTMLAPPSLFLIRLRWPLTVAAGPLTNLLLAFGAWSIPTHSETLELIIPPFVTANLCLPL